MRDQTPTTIENENNSDVNSQLRHRQPGPSSECLSAIVVSGRTLIHRKATPDEKECRKNEPKRSKVSRRDWEY